MTSLGVVAVTRYLRQNTLDPSTTVDPKDELRRDGKWFTCSKVKTW